MLTGQISSQVARRAEVFRRLLEDVRAARAESRALVATVDPAGPSLPAVLSTQTRCARLEQGLQASLPILGHDLSDKIRALLQSLETALSEITLCSLLGPEDESARTALGRARRTVEQDSAHLEWAIRADMAALIVASA